MNFEFDASLKVPPMLTLLWFSRDLRLTDNPALAAAIARVYVVRTFGTVGVRI